jgi:hypothetical protein
MLPLIGDSGASLGDGFIEINGAHFAAVETHCLGVRLLQPRPQEFVVLIEAD